MRVFPRFKLGQVVKYVYGQVGDEIVLYAYERIEDCQSRGTEFFYKVNSNWFPESKLKEVLQ